MESLGEVGRIQVEESTAKLLQESLCPDSKYLADNSSDLSIPLAKFETNTTELVLQPTRLFAADPSTSRERAEW